MTFAPELFSDEHKKGFSYEVVHSRIRREHVLNFLNRNPHKNILEIGGGLDPLCYHIKDFNNYVIIEPVHQFADKISDFAKHSDSIRVIPKFFEDCYQELTDFPFDCIIASGVLHHIKEPLLFLRNVRIICNENTHFYISVPNAYSLHRLCALEIGIIQDIHELSTTNQNMQVQNIFDKFTLLHILDTSGFSIMECGTFFVKPFNNKQMEALIESRIADIQIIQGLYKISKYFPEFGSELYAISRKRLTDDHLC
jgi:2-polyprenyl-3-methyl-5-hydroxy-6-metoxy-1,4-benzoquinol methylase